MPVLKTVVVIGAIAALYAITGLTSGLLAIPPGFSSPVWPAAGLALIAVLFYQRTAVLGVVIGSFLVNLSISQQSLLTPSMAWLPAALIALGAGLQAYISAYLVGRTIAFKAHQVHSSFQIINIAILAGPLSCVISASIGITTLWLHQVIDPEDLFHNWLTWWVGDSIGVIIGVPLLLAINFRHHWSRLQLLRFSLPYICLLFLAVTLFNSAREADNQRITDLFSERSQNFYRAIDRHINTLTKHETVLAESFLIFDKYHEEQFSRIAGKILQITPGIQALSWVRYVTDKDRAQVDKALQTRGSIGISERTNGILQPAQFRKEYFSVFYIEPLAGNENALGFDIGSNSKRQKAIQRTITEKLTTATAPILLVQETDEQALAFLLLAPVISDEGQLKGLISGVYRANDIFDAALLGLNAQHLSASITDITDDNEEVLLYDNGVRGQSKLSWSKELRYSGRTWLIEFTSTNAYLRAERGWTVWGVLTGGFLLVSIFGAFMLTLMNQNYHIEAEVKTKTLALDKALRDSVKANKAKSQFLANMSHELRTPLNSIIGFTQRIKTKYSGEFNSQINDGLDAVLRNGQHLLSLITEVLDISKIEAGKMELFCQETAITPLLEEAVNTMTSSAKEKSLSLVLLNHSNAHLNIDKKRFLQIILNLLSNAVKFTETGSITLSCSSSTNKANIDGVEIKVSDTGKGIPKSLLPKLFKPFEQLQGEDISTPGTGLGLVLSKKMMELHGGAITVESQENKGTTFTLWFPSSPVS